MNAADISMHNVTSVSIDRAKTYESERSEFTARTITIEMENGTKVTINLFSNGQELKLEIN